MRICVVTREYPPVTAYTGGIRTQFATIVPHLVRLGHEVEVMTFGQAARRVLEHDGARFTLVPRPRARRWIPMSDLRWSFRVRDAIAGRGEFDVVFAREWGGDGWVYARRQASGPLITKLATSIRQIAAVGGEAPTGVRLRARYRLQEWRERAQAERSAALVAPSRAVLESTARMWRIDSVPATIIPNAFDLDRIRRLAGARPRPDDPAAGPRVVFFGRLQPLKGVDLLVSAMGRVWDDFPSARLVLAGHDVEVAGRPMSRRLQEMAGARRDRLHLTGALPAEELFPLVAAADVVALPSRWEAFGNVAVEAMALGRPVVLTRCGGFEELCTDEVEGLLVDAGDSAALAAAIGRLLGDAELRRRLGAAAAARADRYGVAPVVARHVELFERVSGGG